jgi:hypothetical protein
MPLLEALKTILEDEKALSEEYVTLLHSKVRVIGGSGNLRGASASDLRIVQNETYYWPT